MPGHRIPLHLAFSISLAVHASLLFPWTIKILPVTPPPLQIELVPPPPEKPKPPQKSKPESPTPPPPRSVERPPAKAAAPLLTTPAPENAPASMPAPPPPSAEEWQLASTYTLRNSKRYRHNWGQLVRSKMGTAIEGPDQGLVRFRIEIGPDGKLAKVEELWSTSALASKLAREAILNLPDLPPTPTGEPLIFEETISFLPYETGWPPSYKLDCEPKPEPFRNPFAWDGKSPQPTPQTSQPHRPPPPDGCPPDSTEDTIEAEDASMKRQMNQWRWAR